MLPPPLRPFAMPQKHGSHALEATVNAADRRYRRELCAGNQN